MTISKWLALTCLLATLSGCKIDLTIIGLGEVKTDSNSIDCAAGTTGDCHQEYVTDANDCDDAGNCTVVGTGTTETFTALPGDDSSFGGWGDICFGAADLTCTHTITPDYAADPDAVLNVTATFDPDPAPQNASYTYNHLGQRASKTVAGITTHFVYSDLDGQLLGEYTTSGSPIREYIYLEGERVAMYDYTGVEPKDSTGQKAIVYLHNDQVGQVQYAFNSNGQMIYERVQTPFGETMGEMSAASLQMPVRFPGQYYDAETGFSQNWNRDYDPSIGRYLQSDPIGQRGGINTYGYVMQNPLMWVDPLGWKGQYTKSPDGKGRKVPYDDSKSIVPPEGSGAGKCWRSRPDEGDGDRLDDDNVCDCKTGDFLKDREAAAQKEAEKKDAENRRKAGEDGFLAPEKDNVAADNSAGYEDSPASNPPVHRAGEGAGPDVVDAIVNGK